MQNMPSIKKVYSQLRSSAKKRNIEFNLTISELYQLDYPISCPILGMPLVFHRGKVEDNSPSIDRLDSSKGYSIDNIQVISFKANRSKSNLSPEELKCFSLYFK